MPISGPLETLGQSATGLQVWRLTSRTIEVAKVERVGVVRLPSREEHGQHRDKRSEGANLGGAVSDSRSLQQTGQGAVQRVNSVAVW